ncbi:DUF5998 family protein [Propionibacteriaceae bacterium Y1685]|uniref:DUF5998 family protein n=1 Tax=Microlunatus sp. Y1700 TaxID=3418487 RepID=UPI003B7EE6A8
MSSVDELRAGIESAGYFPDLVDDAVRLTIADEEIVDFVVHHEPTFNHDEIHRHVTILVLTPTRLIVGHTDDHRPEGPPTGPQAATSTESVALRSIGTAMLTRVVADPAAYRPGQVTEAWLTVTWGAIRRVDIEPASCTDPHCEADHGYTGQLVGDDLVVRMSAAADGVDQVQRLVAFGTRLQRVTA